MSRPESTYSAIPSTAADFAQGNPNLSSPLSQSMTPAPATHAHTGTYTDGSSVVEDGTAGIDGTPSDATTAVPAAAPARSNTLRKRGSVRRANSLKRSNSKRSIKAGSLAGLGGGEHDQEYNSAFSTPIPTQGSPTEILANRFQAWRQLLKSLITYFREIQASYEARAKATHKVQNVMSSITNPSIFMSDHGLGEATRILDDYHKRSLAESTKSRDIEEDVISALNGLRSDLGQKIKEIKSLSGDFKNSVDKEKDTTRREVEKLQEAIQLSEREDGSAIGRNDPYVVKLGVDRAVERQMDEENYLHRAYLNLESSGRELESIVVGEIQKAYNALAGILKREGDDAYTAVEALRSGPIAMTKDAEWLAFVERDPHFIDPSLPLRRIEDIEYPGKHHPSAVEVRAGMLERKSKYLKSYTAGWYVMSPTHLHEFKSADKIYSQPPVMSLYLPDQKLGSHSQADSSSHKFMVKGKQSGNMHKGHNWVFRAETYDTMLAWFEDMRVLTEKTGEEKYEFVRKHARSVSASSRRASMSSDGMEEDEADQVPYSADAASLPSQTEQTRSQRPQPGGRFPSDLQVQRARGESLGQSSMSSGPDAESAALAPIPATNQLAYAQDGNDPYRLDGVTAGTATVSSYNWDAQPRSSYFGQTPLPSFQRDEPVEDQQPHSGLAQRPADNLVSSAEHSGVHEEWVAPAATGAVGTVIAAAALENHDEREPPLPQAQENAKAIPETSQSRTNEPDVHDDAAINAAELTSPPTVGATVTDGIVLPVIATKPVPVDGVEKVESQSAHEASEVSPKIIRNDTQFSVSELHVPGTFPRQG